MDPIQKAIMDSPEYRAMLHTIGEAGEQAAKAAAPVETGKLRKSIRYELTDDGGVAVVSSSPYAANVDRGDAGRAPQPFLSGSAIDGMKRAVGGGG